jgi:ADP-heptose:LPS heptosyltransferase
MTRRVLVARLDSAGDVLLAGPAVRAVAAGGGASSEVALLCSPQGAPAAALLPGVHRTLVWSCPWITDPAPAADQDSVRRLADLLAGSGIDEAVILTSFHQSPLPLALLLRLAGIRRITGSSVDFAGSLLDVRLRPGEDFPEDQPEPLRNLTIVRAAGFELAAGDSGRLAVREGPDVGALVGGGPFVVVHPGAAVPARAWPADNATAAVRRLTKAGHRVLVTGSLAEHDLCSRVAGRSAENLAGRTDLATLASVLGRAAVTVTGNTGPAHLSAAVGTPVVSLFSPVVPAVRWRPYGVPSVLLGDQTAPCRDTRARTCPVPGHPCLTSVTADQVLTAVMSLMEPVSSTEPASLPVAARTLDYSSAPRPAEEVA